MIYVNDHIDVIVSKRDKKVYFYDLVNRKSIKINWSMYLFLLILDSEENLDLSSLDKDKIEKLKTELKKLYIRNILMYNKGKRFSHNLRYELEQNPIKTIQFEVTGKCNFNCKHCYNSDSRKNLDIPLSKIFEIIDDAYEMGVHKICLTGGEPLIRPQIREVLMYLSSKSFSFELYTNGFLLDKSTCDFLNNVNVSKVKISLDGKDSETHDKFRNKFGSYDKVVQAIKYLKSINVPVEINSVLHKKNINNIKEMCEFFQNDLGVKYKLDFIINSGNAKDNYNDIGISINEYCNSMYPYVRKYLKETNIDYTNPCISNDFCGIGKEFIYIKSDGLIKLCPSIDDTYNYGSIFNKRLKDLWNDKLINKYRNLTCRLANECKHISICKGGCRSRGLLLGDKLTDPDLLICNLFK
ncbi:MAG: radical SAM protein [Clostridium argentinense]|nr:radical SAM protein [Clostridium argentinense]